MYQKTYKSKRRRRFSAITAVFLTALLLAGCVQALEIMPTETNILEIFTDPPAKTTLPADTEAPEILEIEELTAYEGDTIAYLSAVTVTDDRDPAPAVTVDSSNVDLTKAGTYEVTYTATDAAGNAAQAAAIVTILPRQEGFVDMAAIDAAADAVLASILWDGATTGEQVHAIYSWARTRISYGGHSDRTDWRQTAYTMLEEGKGDCFGFFAVTKLLFEHLGIPNIDVQKVRNYPDDSDHYWSLVSVDGGDNYYHFDATPRSGDGDDFCLVTDAFLDDYSDAHKGSHNRDRSLYPTTPEEAP